MTIDEKTKQKFIAEVMNTSLFSVEEKLKIINKMINNRLADKEINDISDIIHKFDKGFTEIKNQYYVNMDGIYAQYLDKNIPILKQGSAKMKLEVKEVKMNEGEGDPDMLLNEID